MLSACGHVSLGTPHLTHVKLEDAILSASKWSGTKMIWKNKWTKNTISISTIQRQALLTVGVFHSGALFYVQTFFFFLPSYYHCIKKKNVASNPREERKPDTGKAVLPNQLYHAEPRLDFKDDSHKICINLLRSTLTGPIWQNELKLLKSLSPVALDWQQCCHHCCSLVWSQAFLPPLSHRRPFHPRSTLYFEN